MRKRVNTNNNIVLSMKILNDNDKIQIVNTSLIVSKTKYYKTKKDKKKPNTFYQAYIPDYVEDYLNVKDKVIYFYQIGSEVFLSGSEPVEEHSRMKIQASNQVSIPKMFFDDLENYMGVKLVLDFSKRDKYNKNKFGLCSFEVF